jgi:hypothetical protein
LNLNPARVIRNLMDSMGRDLAYGGNVIDDLDTLFRTTHWEFADDVGILPVELGQSLARMGLDFSEGVPAKLMFADSKPRFGVLSYWADEVTRRQGLEVDKGYGHRDRACRPDASKAAIYIQKAMEWFQGWG